jgi:polysaccharide biosynthesis/export protein
MASSRLSLLPLLSGSAILCSVWAAQLPAQAQPEIELLPAVASLQADLPSDELGGSIAADDLAGVVASEMPDAGATAFAEPPLTVAPKAAESLAAVPAADSMTEAVEENAIAATPEAQAPAAQVPAAQAPAMAPAQAQTAPMINFPGSEPASLDFNNPASLPAPQDLMTDYVLGPGDQILVLVLGYEEFAGARVVLPDGSITMPLIGSVPAAGRTVGALAQDIQSRLAFYLTDPVVDANLTILRPVVVNIAGEVYRPGPVQLSSLTQVNTFVNPTGNVTNATNTPSLSSALAAAGGIKRTANIREIIVQRRLPNGQRQQYTVNLWDALLSGQDPGNVVLADGDTVFVPLANGDDNLDRRLIASSSFSPTNVRVRVVGEVVRPGEVTVQPNSSISSAVAAAGGPSPETAQLNNVTLVRLNDDGEIERETVDLSNLIDNYQIQDGDVVVVPKRGHLGALDAISRIFSPLLAPLGIINTINDLFFNN